MRVTARNLCRYLFWEQPSAGLATVAEFEMIAAANWADLFGLYRISFWIAIVSCLLWPMFYLSWYFALPRKARSIRPFSSNQIRGLGRKVGVGPIMLVLAKHAPPLRLRPETLVYIAIVGHVWAICCWWFVMQEQLGRI